MHSVRVILEEAESALQDSKCATHVFLVAFHPSQPQLVRMSLWILVRKSGDRPQTGAIVNNQSNTAVLLLQDITLLIFPEQPKDAHGESFTLSHTHHKCVEAKVCVFLPKIAAQPGLTWQTKICCLIGFGFC